MRQLLVTTTILALAASAGTAQQAPAEGGFVAGEPLGVTTDGETTAMSDNVKVFGSFIFAESCSYDEGRDLIIVVNRGAGQAQIPNDGFVSLINHDGSVHTAKWIGASRDGLVLNDPLGSDIGGGMLYVADRDGGTSEDEPTVAVIRMFDLESGAPAGEMRVEGSPWLNDIEVAEDGTVYASQSGDSGPDADPTSWRLYRITPEGEATIIVEGAPLARPNGVAFDGDGNVVVVNIESDDVLTYSPEGELLNTEKAAQPGSDGLVIMPDGTKYVSSVRRGGVSRIPPDGEAELIAVGIPSAASMCYDAGANQLAIPMNPNNALALVPLEASGGN
ncbi:SMP-30/gluconolactonase/LRE family protein [Roseitranquillus sediminis]|uniref:SMP-30/gluconolactonase/LRE family protein n=1 Tax=Roseitranquillus sediminis TaxID=2809051 RepID=UPI001D0C8331|nr:SMP-30/gluconolactonase/LRE family protein [Roseitranquillus sediminis]MBM9595473.1 SMP-30/gluconolactonase/LRE family protein [Roseitranquillus sediminis]